MAICDSVACCITACYSVSQCLIVLGTAAFAAQSPALLKHMGRDKFVPVQMRLTKVLFATLEAMLVVMAAATMMHSAITSRSFVTACVALAAGAANKYWVVPLALKQGALSITDIKGKNAHASVAGFASAGAGNKTRQRHRMVVVFVVIMLVGTAAHGLAILSLL